MVCTPIIDSKSCVIRKGITKGNTLVYISDAIFKLSGDLRTFKLIYSSCELCITLGYKYVHVITRDMKAPVIFNIPELKDSEIYVITSEKIGSTCKYLDKGTVARKLRESDGGMRVMYVKTMLNIPRAEIGFARTIKCWKCNHCENINNYATKDNYCYICFEKHKKTCLKCKKMRCSFLSNKRKFFEMGCSGCKKRFDTIKGWESHACQHVNPIPTNICNICKIPFTKSIAYLTHGECNVRNKYRMTPIVHFECLTCRKTFETFEAWKYHTSNTDLEISQFRYVTPNVYQKKIYNMQPADPYPWRQKQCMEISLDTVVKCLEFFWARHMKIKYNFGCSICKICFDCNGNFLFNSNLEYMGNKKYETNQTVLLTKKMIYTEGMEVTRIGMWALIKYRIDTAIDFSRHFRRDQDSMEKV